MQLGEACCAARPVLQGWARDRHWEMSWVCSRSCQAPKGRQVSHGAMWNEWMHGFGCRWSQCVLSMPNIGARIRQSAETKDTYPMNRSTEPANILMEKQGYLELMAE